MNGEDSLRARGSKDVHPDTNSAAAIRLALRMIDRWFIKGPLIAQLHYEGSQRKRVGSCPDSLIFGQKKPA
jgi:hypothetical protein